MENLDNLNTEPQSSINLDKKEDRFQSRIDMIELRTSLEKVKSEIAKVIVGQESMIEHLLAALLSNGHVLIEGVPGVAKTITAKLLAKTIDVGFSRIQFTPDLMPSDITGSETLDNDRNFRFIKGPIFSNIILADEINRTPPKTQSALLESMQEYAVTIAGQKYPLSKPFFVLATQNPIEQEGTYPLPEAQLDRFMFMIQLDYPRFEAELAIVKATTSDIRYEVQHQVTGEEILYFQQLVRRVPIADNVVEYAVRLVHKTRPRTELASKEANEFLEWGAGPRASQNLILAAKCNALFNGKFSPDIEDVKAVALAILRHRIVRNFKAEAEGVSVEDIVKRIV